MEIRFFSFSKKVNSTAIPTGSASGTYQIQLKDDTSLMNPTIIMRKSDYNFSWNYAYIPLFDRYYRVGDPRITAGHMVEIPLTEDVLASNRSEIADANAYIEYWAGTSNVYLPDNRLTINPTPTYHKNNIDSGILSSTGYVYMITVIGDASNSNLSPFNQAYIIDETNLQKLTKFLVTDPLNIYDSLIKQFSDAFGCVMSLVKLPLKSSIFDSELDYITLGHTKLDATAGGEAVLGQPIKDYVLSEVLSIVIPWQSDDFRRLAPFSELYLYLPFVGVVSLSSSDFIGVSSVRIELVVSLLTRQITYRICIPNADGTRTPIATYGAQFGYTVPVASIQTNTTGAISASVGAVASVVGAVASGGSSLAVTATTTATAVSSAVNLTNNLSSTVSQVGNFNGGGLEKYGINPTIILKYHNTIVEPITVTNYMGAPFAQVGRIGSHPGYIKCNDASINIAVNEGELEEINGFLNTGVFIE